MSAKRGQLYAAEYPSLYFTGFADFFFGKEFVVVLADEVAVDHFGASGQRGEAVAGAVEVFYFGGGSYQRGELVVGAGVVAGDKRGATVKRVEHVVGTVEAGCNFHGAALQGGELVAGAVEVTDYGRGSNEGVEEVAGTVDVDVCAYRPAFKRLEHVVGAVEVPSDFLRGTFKGGQPFAGAVYVAVPCCGAHCFGECELFGHGSCCLNAGGWLSCKGKLRDSWDILKIPVLPCMA